MSLASRIISPMAASGPSTAPTVSSACRSPYAPPRTSAGVTSAISASRGAPRIPLPTRSMKRATSTSGTDPASGNSGFDAAASA